MTVFLSVHFSSLLHLLLPLSFFIISPFIPPLFILLLKDVCEFVKAALVDEKEIANAHQR